MQNSAAPSLLDVVRVEKIDDGIRIVCGERHSDINQAGAEIVELMDGARSLDEIARNISQAHKSSQYKEVQQKVQRFLHDLWKQGIYLKHDIDIPLIYDYCRIGDYAVVPSHCEIEELPICYLSPCYNVEAMRTIDEAFKHLAGACIRIVHFDINARIDQCILLLKTKCRYTFALHSIYGKDDVNILRETRDSILGYLADDGDSCNADTSISILKFHKGFEQIADKNEKIAYTLANEFPDSDLVVTEIVI